MKTHRYIRNNDLKNGAVWMSSFERKKRTGMIQKDNDEKENVCRHYPLSTKDKELLHRNNNNIQCPSQIACTE